MQLNLNASGADGKEAISLERIADGDVAIDGDQHSQPHCRTLGHVAERIHVLYTPHATHYNNTVSCRHRRIRQAFCVKVYI